MLSRSNIDYDYTTEVCSHKMYIAMLEEKLWILNLCATITFVIVLHAAKIIEIGVYSKQFVIITINNSVL